MDQARLIYGLVVKMDMDVGSIISQQITQIAQSSTSRLSFPTLIITLCDALGVGSDTLTYKPLSLMINLAYIKKNCRNPTDSSITFPWPRRVCARATQDAPPPVVPPLAAPSSASLSSSSFSQQEPLVQKIQCIDHGQRLIIENLHQLSIHLAMDHPLMMPEDFIQRVAWPGVQPSTNEGMIPLALEMLQMLKQTLIMLRISWPHREIGTHGPYRTEAILS